MLKTRMALGSRAVLAFAIAFLIIVTEPANVFKPCPSVPSQEDFDINLFLGMWSVYAKPGGAGPCLSYTFNYKEGNAGHITMTYQYFIISGLVSYNVTIAETSDDPGSFSLVAGFNPKALRVVQTDYINYAVLLRCLEYMNNSYFTGFMLLTRTPGDIPESEVAEIYSTFNISDSSMKLVDQNGMLCSPLIVK